MARFLFLLSDVDAEAGAVGRSASDSDPLPTAAGNRCSCTRFLDFPFGLDGFGVEGLFGFRFCDIGITSVSESNGLENLK